MRLLALLLLVGCSQTLDERLAELDDQANVDCGDIGDCSSQSHVDEVEACLRENLAAGIAARSTWILGLEEVAYVYALDGTFVTIQGYYYEGPNFTEYECGDIQTNAGSPMTCWMAHTIECTEVRDWYD